MQARLAAFSALALVLVAAPAFAQTGACPETEHDRHVFVSNATAEPQAGYVGSANGGVWKTTDGGRPSAEAPAAVQAPPQEGRTDALLELGGVEGDSGQAGRPSGDGVVILNSGAPAAADPQIQAPGGQSTALLVPAVQQVRRETAGLPKGPEEQPSADVQAQGGTAQTAPRDPEMPICANCGADAQAQAQPQPQQQRRGGFSISIGGVSIGTGGVRVAVGDVNGDGRESGRAHSSVRPVSERPN